MYTHGNIPCTHTLTYLLPLNEVFPPEVVPLLIGRPLSQVPHEIQVALSFPPYRNVGPVCIAGHAVLREYVDPHLGRVPETRLDGHQVRLAGGSLTEVGQQFTLFRVRT